jgi:hypothetical protein
MPPVQSELFLPLAPSFYQIVDEYYRFIVSLNSVNQVPVLKYLEPFIGRGLAMFC